MRIQIPRQEETCAKLPIDVDERRMESAGQRQSMKQASKMKLNWRANWEILLVLVIIIIGIVITTIAAIRSKDKHHRQLLALPDDAADYGSLAEPASSSQHQVPQLPQTDFQLQGARESLVNDEGGGGGGGAAAHMAATNSPFAATTGGPSDPLSGRLLGSSNSNNNKLHSNSHSGHHHQQAAVSASSLRKLASTSGAHSKQLGSAAARTNSAPLETHSAQSAGYEQAAAHLATGSRQSGNSLERYDTLSTESTPTQVARLMDSSRATKSTLINGRQSGAQRHKTGEPIASHEMSPASDSSSETGELLDDFHTTRSALAGQPAAQTPSADGGRVQEEQMLRKAAASPPTPPPLTLHGPYELLPSVAHTQNTNQPLAGSLAQHSRQMQANKTDSLPAETDDIMMTSYSRLPTHNHSNLSEALLRDYNLATPANPTSDSNSSSRAEPRWRTYSASASSVALPFSMLLADILRVARPNSAALINTQAGLEQPANAHRPQYSILQQLRSLPGPLLALLQGTSTSGSGAQPPSAATLSESSLGLLAAGASHHDASESSQHYQRISMSPSDMSAILSRSLRATAVLPAFPPPKGTPQTWVPPTAGGIPINDAVSSSADFVSSNTAGFLRETNAQAAGATQAGSTSSAASSSQDTSAQSIASSQPQQQQQNIDSQTIYQQQPVEMQQQQQQQQQMQQFQRQTNEAANYPLLDEVPNGIQQQQQQQMATNVNLNHAQAQGVFQQPEVGYRPTVGQQAYMQQQQQRQPSFPNGNLMQSGASGKLQAQMNQMAPQQTLYKARQSNSELFESVQNNVPLAYSQQQQQQQQQLTAQLLSQNNFLQQQLALAQAQAQAQAQQSSRPSAGYDFSALSIESAPKASVLAADAPAAKSSGPALKSPLDPVNTKQRLSLAGSASGPQTSASGGQPIQLNAIKRSKRALRQLLERRQDGPEALDEEEEEEEYLDSRPMSIVSPDGRPMSGRERAKVLRQHERRPEVGADPIARASSGRQVAQQDLDESAMHHYASQGAAHEPASGRPAAADKASRKSVASPGSLEYQANRFHEEHDDQSHSGKPFKRRAKKFRGDEEDNAAGRSRKKLKLEHGKADEREAKKRAKLAGNLETAGSGLMSKLLGTASSNNDEVDDELDNDDEDGASAAQERRKEEQEEAEFGMANDGRHGAPPRADDGNSLNSLEGDGRDSSPLSPPSDEVSRLSGQEALINGQSNGPVGSGERESSVGAGSAGSNSYTRRNQQQQQQQQQQQRPDVEFYGHAGEETRQLKYGILGSGNYEVVNGGIYPDVDESTAAVNSVANYVRKPANLLLAGLPKLLAEAAAGSPGNGLEQHSAPNYMPGGRMSGVSGFMRGASAHPEELAGLFAPPMAAAAAAPSGGKLSHLAGNPLLELIDANSGQLLGPNLMAQLGSSGSSARTTFSSEQPAQRDEERAPGEQNHDDDDDQGARRPLKKQAAVGGEPSRSRRVRPAEDGYEIEQSQHQHASAALRRSKGRPETASAASESEREAEARRLQTGSKGQGTNQFYSYQILPSKKVTIFSDQDLDSAPSEAASVSLATLSTFAQPPARTRARV